MVEVVKKGVIRYRWTCQHCKCEFICDETDENIEPIRDDRGGGWIIGEERNINCPTCRTLLSSMGSNRTKVS
jgi:hypothetical protein